MLTPLIAERVGHRYGRGGPWAIRGVSLAVPEASITALVGPNGAGKSTIIRSCLGFERPAEGRIIVNGIDPRRDRARAVESTGYVPQSAALYRGLTIRDHFVMAAAARRRFDRAYAGSRLQAIGLTDRRRVGELSSGEQAQVALSLALGSRPPLLLLDEPLASLDPLARREFLTVLVDDVRERGATAVLSSHVVADVEQACDRLVVLTDGRVVLDATIAEAKQQFRILVAAELGPNAAVGQFADPTGVTLALIASRHLGRPASLEEIVLGHLAAARAQPLRDAA